MNVECIYNYNPEGKRPYHHIITNKFDNCVKKFENLLDIVDNASLVKRGTKEQVLNWITNENDYKNLQYFLQDDLGFIYLNLNTLNYATKREKIFPCSMAEQMVEIFISNIYPTHPFINLEKIYQLSRCPMDNNPLLISILFRTQLLLSNLQSPNKPINMEDLYFYKLACHHLSNTDIVSLEILQAHLLLAGIESQYLAAPAKMRLPKCIQMGNILNIFDFDSINQSNDSVKTKLEKCATGFFSSIVDNRLSFVYKVPKFKVNRNYLANINLDTTHIDSQIQNAKFWTNAMLLHLYLSDYMINIVKIQAHVKKYISDPDISPLELDHIYSLRTILTFASTSTISQLPSNLLSDPTPTQDPNHNEKVILSFNYLFLKLYLCDLGDLISRSQYYQKHKMPESVEELLNIRNHRLMICEKVLTFVNRDAPKFGTDQFSAMTPPPSPVDSVNVTFHPLELADVKITFVYFIVVQSFVSRGSFLYSTRLLNIVNKLKILSPIWPITKGLYDLVSGQNFQYSYTVTVRDLPKPRIKAEID
ncbi:hypothetical protein CONCODRAFT_85547 [Conidiobolus coronatus NRRL 28638]|uniref:Uncharacterized protein n=1 Tax=Conidiobolus coronatus (strain ATCC 28846 / CBS 209.66 / NRRL 28638) TaxID=796925 RepID=A0A137P4P9_CONC2|nr:hypothetical protein CONCODRAFT_85547 [Conidiobolus coronatus NRRL 28638]|eukprot:KXN70000.1 hypothetical protein CONCODRAFT_85547 [Conidiobolus coronatus NRRL 28638]